MTVKGVDYSHYQSPPNTSSPPNVPELQRAGIEFVMIKAWEADSPDPNYIENLANARAGSMPLMAYVWVHASDTNDRMQRCFDFIDGAVLMLDWEENGVVSSVVEAWMDAYETRFGRPGAAYYGLYPPDTPTERIGKWLRVFPEYTSPSGLKLKPWDGSPNPDWRNCWAIWQSSDKGSVKGIEGNCDLDQLAACITIEDFTAWLDTATPPPPRPDIVKPAIILLQSALNHMGYNAGATDGLWGSRTQTAINSYSGYNG